MKKQTCLSISIPMFIALLLLLTNSVYSFNADRIISIKKNEFTEMTFVSSFSPQPTNQKTTNKTIEVFRIIVRNEIFQRQKFTEGVLLFNDIISEANVCVVILTNNIKLLKTCKNISGVFNTDLLLNRFT